MSKRIYLLVQGIVVGGLVAIGGLVGAAYAQVAPEMRTIVRVFHELQGYTYSYDVFQQPQHRKAVLRLLGELDDTFGEVGEHSVGGRDPGFEETLVGVRSLISDARDRFANGKVAYSFWRLKEAEKFCVSCHVRHQVTVDFRGEGAQLPEGMDPLERAEYLFATRQFEEGRQALEALLDDATYAARRHHILRLLLLYHVRVHPDPHQALQKFDRIRRLDVLSDFERQLVETWIESMRRWANERSPSVGDVRRAWNLIRQGIEVFQPRVGSSGEVEFLRATALLHGVLDRSMAGSETSELSAEDHRKSLYYLGLAYSQLESFFPSELAELFLEECIERFPGTPEARKAYVQYHRLVSLGYTGSGGEHLPKGVVQDFRRLYQLAY